MKGNKTVIAVLVILALIILGGGAYFALGKKGGPGPKGNAAGSQGHQESSSPKTLKDLLTSGVSQKCTFTNTTEDGSTTMEGVVYASGGKVRGDFTSKTKENTFITHIVVENKTNYMWMEGQKTGYKITVDENTASPSTESQQTNTTVDMNKSFDYQCSPWVVDNSLFTVPTSVTFTDMGSLANPSPAASGSTSDTSSQCSACSSLTGEAKTQCLTVLKCQ